MIPGSEENTSVLEDRNWIQKNLGGRFETIECESIETAARYTGTNKKLHT